MHHSRKKKNRKTSSLKAPTLFPKLEQCGDPWPFLLPFLGSSEDYGRLITINIHPMQGSPVGGEMPHPHPTPQNQGSLDNLNSNSCCDTKGEEDTWRRRLNGLGSLWGNLYFGYPPIPFPLSGQQALKVIVRTGWLWWAENPHLNCHWLAADTLLALEDDLACTPHCEGLSEGEAQLPRLCQEQPLGSPKSASFLESSQKHA